GKHTVAIEAAGHARFEASVEVGPGKTAQLDARLQTAAVGENGDGVTTGDGDGDGGGKPGGTSRALFWVAAGVTAASVAGFTVTGLQVLSIQDEIESTEVTPGEDVPAGIDIMDKPCPQLNRPVAMEEQYEQLGPLRDKCAQGDTMSTVTNVLIGVAVAGGLAAGYFYYSGYMQDDGDDGEVARRQKKKPSNATVKLTPTITPDYVGAGVKIEF
ncbi:MAG TPA: hypothetical protein VNM90_16625, partial [Haliangium sp.]|nr:hypothetical protein [Haliangium sp.]